MWSKLNLKATCFGDIWHIISPPFGCAHMLQYISVVICKHCRKSQNRVRVIMLEIVEQWNIKSCISQYDFILGFFFMSIYIVMANKAFKPVVVNGI